MMETAILFRIFLVSFCINFTKTIDIEEEITDDNKYVTKEITAVATTESLRSSRAYRRGHNVEDEHEDEHDEMKETKVMGKSEYLGGYYDFLINEGSYKFWAVFQLATAALLIYSGFAALYYAKVNPSTTDDYDDYFLQRKRRRRDTDFFGINSMTFQRIMEALEKRNYEN